MEDKVNPLVRFSDEDIQALMRLRALAKMDRRTIGGEMAFLVDAEYARRFSTPQPVITIEDAQRAAQQ